MCVCVGGGGGGGWKLEYLSVRCALMHFDHTGLKSDT